MAAPAYQCFRYLVFSGDRTAGSTSEYRITLSPAFHRVAYIDWAASSIAGYLLQIPEVKQHARTSGNQMYWRFVDDLRNGRIRPLPEQTELLYDLQSLSIRWLNPDGSLATGLPEHVLELEVYTQATV